MSGPEACDPRLARKALLREQTLRRRDLIPAEQRAAAAQAIAGHAFPVPVRTGTIVSGFMPIRSEISPWPLLHRLVDAGARLALPCVNGRGRPLTLRSWHAGEPLIRAQWGIREPAPAAPEVAPDIVIVPLAAFDRRGYRIGYGAGYYDMTLERLRTLKATTAIGVGFAVQEVPEVPAFAYDQKLDFVLTEHEVIVCQP